MKSGHLSQYFEAIAYKHLSAVEASPDSSHQHEFNGVVSLIEILGDAGSDKKKFPTKFIFLDSEGQIKSEEAELTWYDSRAKSAKRTEHRLYFPASLSISEDFSEGDLLVIGKKRGDGLIAIAAQSGTAAESQVKWLFGIENDVSDGFSIKDERTLDNLKTGFALNSILEELGFVIEPDTDEALDVMIQRFGIAFPSTHIFSAFARSLAGDVSPNEDPDGALVSWMEREEQLFRVFEKHLLADRVKAGFDDVDAFVKLSLSVQNKRKSRAGFALQNHLSKVFDDVGLTYSRDGRTENKKKPDFIFPSVEKYHDLSFPIERLTMLGAKTSCKDRWRQVLSEADRINLKHLITLETGISVNQTDEMRSKSLQLVVPKSIFKSYTSDQKAWLLDLTGFIGIVKGRQ